MNENRLPRPWDHARLVTGRLHRSAWVVGDAKRRRLLGQLRLLDGRRWRGGYGGPPFGVFRKARLRWWQALNTEVQASASTGVVLSPRQLDDLLHLAEMQHSTEVSH